MPGCGIAEAIRLKHKPVALHWSDDKPENVVQFDKGSWGCVMFLVVAAAKGKIAVLDRDTCGCVGGAVGMGFGNLYPDFPGGIDCFYHFLSSGNKSWEKGRTVLHEENPRQGHALVYRSVRHVSRDGRERGKEFSGKDSMEYSPRNMTPPPKIDPPKLSLLKTYPIPCLDLRVGNILIGCQALELQRGEHDERGTGRT